MNLFSIITAASSAAESTAESVAESMAETAAEITMVPEDFVFDYSSRVPILSIIFMVIAMALIIAVPCYLLFRMKNRFHFELYALTFGLLAYMVGVGILPSVAELLLAQIPPLKSFLTDHVVYADLLHAVLLVVFSFAAIWVCMRFALRKSASVFAGAAIMGTAVGLLPILTQGLSYLMSYLSASISINQGQLVNSVTSMLEDAMAPEEIQSGLDSMAAFIETPSYEFLFLGTDLVLQLATFLGVSILLGIYIGRKAKTSLYKALAVQLVFGIFFGLRCTGALKSSILCEVIYLAVAAFSILIAWTELKTYLPADLEKFLGKPDPKLTNRGGKDDKPHKMPKIVMPKD